MCSGEYELIAPTANGLAVGQVMKLEEGGQEIRLWVTGLERRRASVQWRQRLQD
jgi:hypothetical protein